MDQRIPSPSQAAPGILLPPEILCKVLSISRRKLRSWVAKKVFPEPLRIGPDGRILRWHPADVRDYLQSTRGLVAAQAALQGLADEAGKQNSGR
jgi:predicted DNA-binding transcriptional regulator AlpA